MSNRIYEVFQILYNNEILLCSVIAMLAGKRLSRLSEGVSLQKR